MKSSEGQGHILICVESIPGPRVPKRDVRNNNFLTSDRLKKSGTRPAPVLFLCICYSSASAAFCLGFGLGCEQAVPVSWEYQGNHGTGGAAMPGA